jgi:hypothetical protein
MKGFEHDQAVNMGIAPGRDWANINLNLRVLSVKMSAHDRSKLT